MKKYYYLRFRPTANIDYLYLLAFYDLAEYNEERKVFDTIRYPSVRVLAESLKISPATVKIGRCIFAMSSPRKICCFVLGLYVVSVVGYWLILRVRYKSLCD